MIISKISLTAYQLKIIAIIAMFFDHFVAIFIPHDTIISIILRSPGRIAAPIMCYFIAEGYHYTSNRKKYILRLLIFAVVSHIPYNLCFGYSFFQATSVIWGLTMGLIALTAAKDDKLNKFIKLIIIIACCALSITANWNFVTVLWILFFGIFNGKFLYQILSFLVIGVLFHLIPTYLQFGPSHDIYPHWYQLGIILSIPLLIMYNGKLGKKSKFMSWFFYAFYPAHLLFIYGLDRFTMLATYFKGL